MARRQRRSRLPFDRRGTLADVRRRADFPCCVSTKRRLLTLLPGGGSQHVRWRSSKTTDRAAYGAPADRRAACRSGSRNRRLRHFTGGGGRRAATLAKTSDPVYRTSANEMEPDDGVICDRLLHGRRNEVYGGPRRALRYLS